MANVDLAFLNNHELALNTSTSMRYTLSDYADTIIFVNKGKIKLKPLQTKHFPFQEFFNAYKYIDDNREKTMKVLIDVDK